MFTIDLKGKTAIVTGGGQGLAKCTAEVLADCGANIMIADLNEDTAKNSAKEIADKYGVKTDAMKCNIADKANFEEVFKKTKADFGQIDIVINAAGFADYNNLDRVTPEQIQRIIDVNIVGTSNGCHLAYEYMKDNKEGGKVVNFSSTAGRASNITLPYYAMTKAAVINLTQSFAEHMGRVAKVPILFNCVCPGIIKTDMWGKFLGIVVPNDNTKQDAVFADICQRLIPLGVPQEPIDIANAVCFLVSPQNRYITGQALNVCGGYAMN